MTRLFVKGRILLGSEIVPGAVYIENGTIAGVLREPCELPAGERILTAPLVAPGFIDLQVNGGFDCEVGDDPDALARLAAQLPATGVTAFLPTAITSPADVYPRVLAAFERLGDVSGARPLGLHLEGPFLSPARPGAHRRDLIECADPGLIELFVASPAVRLVTLAPERPGAAKWIRALTEAGIAVSLGHTDATYEQMVAGADAGAVMATHLFNAMSPFAHRAPGAIGAALLDDRLTVGIIPDGVHTHPEALRLAVRVKGTDGIAPVTDMMAAAGMPPGEYSLAGRPVRVDGESARLADGTLAGSIVTMDAVVRNMVRWAGVTPAEALCMVSAVPARILGVPLGRIQAGRDADLVLLDDDLTVQGTLIAGHAVYGRANTLQ
jgi:N-acetylglucosamine-6-phosphate deacetylase